MERWLQFSQRWGPALAVMLVIFWASGTSSRDLPQFGGWDTLFKKGGHALGYALLGAAYVRGLRGERPAWPRGRVLGLALGLAAAYALTDEAHQLLTPGRHPALSDVAIDTAGAAVGVWLAGRLGRR